MSQLVRTAREALEKADTEVGDSPACTQKVMIACARALCCEIVELYTALDAIKGMIQFTSGRPREITSQARREV